MQIQVIEWPTGGSARRFPMGGWYVVEYREGRGYTPLAGPFRTKPQAAEAAREHRVSTAAEAVEPLVPRLPDESR